MPDQNRELGNLSTRISQLVGDLSATKLEQVTHEGRYRYCGPKGDDGRHENPEDWQEWVPGETKLESVPDRSITEPTKKELERIIQTTDPVLLLMTGNEYIVREVVLKHDKSSASLLIQAFKETKAPVLSRYYAGVVHRDQGFDGLIAMIDDPTTDSALKWSAANTISHYYSELGSQTTSDGREFREIGEKLSRLLFSENYEYAVRSLVGPSREVTYTPIFTLLGMEDTEKAKSLLRRFASSDSRVADSFLRMAFNEQESTQQRVRCIEYFGIAFAEFHHSKRPDPYGFRHFEMIRSDIKRLENEASPEISKVARETSAYIAPYLRLLVR